MKIFINPFYYFVLFILIWGDAHSTNYYISATGSNSNNGLTTSSPWQSISKVNSMMSTFNPGDQILFKRGDTFFGTLIISRSGTAGNLITFGSYGTGNQPVITGKKVITGWTVHSGNIYKANLTDTAAHLYIGNKIMTIARFPNSGFLKVDAGNGHTGIYDAALTQSNGYWNGANCRLRTANWSYETKLISSFSSGNITFSSATQFITSPNYGYFLDNKLNLLDSENEWYYDKAGSKIYFHAPGGVNPGTLNVEASVLKNGITINLNIAYVKITDLKVSGFKDLGIDNYTSNNNIFYGCTISQNGIHGIRSNGSNIIIENNTFEDNLNCAIDGGMPNGLIRNNTIKRTGLIPGYGSNGWGYVAMSFWVSAGIIIEGNVIDSTGYNGIAAGPNFLVRKNLISNSVLTLNDGGGIYATSAENLQLLDNIVSYSKGNPESSSYPAYYASGIYVNGAEMSNTTIQGNTLYGCSYNGMVVDIVAPAVNSKIIGNLMYNNFYGQILFTDYSSPAYIPNYNITVKNNKFYSISAAQNCMEQLNFFQTSYSDWGTFDSNYYCNPYSELVIRKTKNQPVYATNLYDLPEWKNDFAEDAHSKISAVSFSQYGITDTLSPNLIVNPQFNTNLSSWSTWPPAGSTISYSTHPALDGGCMRMTWNGSGFPQSFTINDDISITKNSYYLSSISCVGVNSGTFKMWMYPSALPINYFTYANTRKNHSYIFKADTTNSSETFSIMMALPDTLLYVDNVSLYKVEVLSSTLGS